MLINKEDFCNIMDHFQKNIDFANKLDIVAKEYNREEWFRGYQFIDDAAETYIINILSVMFDDTNNWIEYWVYDLECGTRYEVGIITDAKGNIIPLKTSAELYNLLLDNIEK